ncbi:MAG: hypothetical protein COA73_06975 [Candidatus Hydrogenedentota bacterium]|nr:MAG: hypothetical protein COA73_06975 [Candidatus Hydrogenedentota bacterium]
MTNPHQNTPKVEHSSLTDADQLMLSRMTRMGWGLCAVWVATLVIWAIIQPDPYAQGWRLVLELLFAGRLVNIADGMGNGFSQIYLFIQSAPQDIILLLIFYPLIIRAYHGAVRRKLIGNTINRLRKSAERRKHIVEPFGAMGLWIFVFFPFWSTGSLVGGVVGYLMGLRTWVTFTSVFTGHIISVVSLIWFFDAMTHLLETFNQGIVQFLPLFVIGALIAGTLLIRLIRKTTSIIRHNDSD